MRLEELAVVVKETQGLFPFLVGLDESVTPTG